MLNIGCHLSVAKGYHAMGKEASKINANTFQFFTRNPRGSRAKEINIEDAEMLREHLIAEKFAPILAHAPYTLNACSPKEETRNFAKEAMEDDLKRLDLLPCSLYNFHPGSHVGQGISEGIQLITSMLNEILKPEQTTIVLLETMSGKGTEVGSTFEELQQIIEGVKLQDKIGVCLDTCHVNDSGYDIVNDLDGVLEEFDRIIGLDRLYAIHLNDSMNPRGSRKDRHEKIGDGFIGFPTFVNIINHPKLCHLPFFLETPNELDGYEQEIRMLRNAYICDR